LDLIIVPVQITYDCEIELHICKQTFSEIFKPASVFKVEDSSLR